MAARLPIDYGSKTGASKGRGAVPAEAADCGGGNFSGGGRQISEADLHGYIDGDLDAADHLDVEAFLAAHPLIAERVERYRSEIVTVNAAFRAGENSLPPALATLGARYARAVRASSRVAAALGILGLVAILCVMAETARGAFG